VNDDHATIAREMDIDFDGIGSLLPGEIDCGQRIFRRVIRCSAMSDDFHGGLKSYKVEWVRIQIAGGAAQPMLRRRNFGFNPLAVSADYSFQEV